MLDQNTSAQLKTLLERLEGPIELVATLNGSEKSDKIKELVEEVAALSPLVTARFDGQNYVHLALVWQKPVKSLVSSLRVYRWDMSSPL